MTYSIKPLNCDPARIKGMSERLILSHYENNYGGAVKRLNLIEEKLAELDYANAAAAAVSGPAAWAEDTPALKDGHPIANVTLRNGPEFRTIPQSQE
jgi:hypothetical protein